MNNREFHAPKGHETIRPLVYRHSPPVNRDDILRELHALALLVRKTLGRADDVVKIGGGPA